MSISYVCYVLVKYVYVLVIYQYVQVLEYVCYIVGIVFVIILSASIINLLNYWIIKLINY